MKEKEVLQKATIYFAGMLVEIPESYVLVSPESFANQLINSGEPSNFTRVDLQKIENLKSMSRRLAIYADTANFENNIWFQQGEYVQLTESISHQYLEMLEQQLHDKWTPQGIKYKRSEGKFISSKSSQIIKLKYKLTQDESSRFTTQYIVSAKSKTVGIVVNGLTSTDYEALIKGLEMQ